MKRILCYGDSNTWGTDDKTHNRLDEKTRFTKLLQKKLGKNFEVIEEGLRSRTLAIDDIKPPKGIETVLLILHKVFIRTIHLIILL